MKPFDFGELLARLRALQRRPALTTGPVLKCADLAFDPASRQVTIGGEPIALTSTETSLLEILIRRSPAVVTRRAIAIQAWDDEADAVGSNTIDVHIGTDPGEAQREPRSDRHGPGDRVPAGPLLTTSTAR